jgi:hypothetical protein
MHHRLLARHEKLDSFHLEVPSPQAGEGKIGFPDEK